MTKTKLNNYPTIYLIGIDCILKINGNWVTGITWAIFRFSVWGCRWPSEVRPAHISWMEKCAAAKGGWGLGHKIHWCFYVLKLIKILPYIWLIEMMLCQITIKILNWRNLCQWYVRLGFGLAVGSSKQGTDTANMQLGSAGDKGQTPRKFLPCRILPYPVSLTPPRRSRG